MAITSERPLRRDAERNRQRIVDTAGVLFAERGLGVSLDEIARHAGVGVGTVYRRFPDKEQLIDALFEDRLAEILRAATDSAEMSDPWEALAHFLERSMELQAKDRGLKELLIGTSTAHARIERAREQIRPIVTALLDRAQQAGVVREDIGVPDLMLLQHAIGESADYTREVAPEAWRRLLSIALDGLRPDRRRPTPMPVPPLSEEQVVCSMREWGLRRRR
ncbi:MAG: TetR/AcrR family transcriptional regulator [Solirubrobacterales bacterium]|jgi:AcrR family transcriptional regulator|nr:TetR/AcrR family transcriptional regulator [Solirubrobacterales bacterium]